MQIEVSVGSHVIDCILLLSVFFLITSNNTHGDILNYMWSFNDDDGRESEIIYNYFTLIAIGLGANFYWFRAALLLISSLFLVKAFNYCKLNIRVFIFFYMIILMFMDSIQFRNTICIWTLAWALTFIANNRIKDKILYTLVIFVLAQIHTAFIFYLILILIPQNLIKKEYRRLVFVIVTILTVIMLITDRIPFLDSILSAIMNKGDDRITRYNTSGRLGFLYPTFLHIILYMLVYKLILKNRKHQLIPADYNPNICQNLIRYLEVVERINLISFVFVPFMLMNMNYYRFIRNAYFLSMIPLVGLLNVTIINKNDRKLIISVLLVITILWFVFETQIYNTAEEIIDPILEAGVPFFQAE